MQNRPYYRQLGDLPESLGRERRGGQILDPMSGVALDWINRYKITNFGVVVGLANLTVLNENALRCYLLVQNKDAANDLFLTFNNEANSFDGFTIIPRGNFELIGGEAGGAFVPKSSVNLIGAAAGLNVVVAEGTLEPYEISTRL